MIGPHTQKEDRGFMGQLNYISQFISHLTDKCDPIFKLFKKHDSDELNEDCQKAFDQVKEYLSNPSYLGAFSTRKIINPLLGNS